MAVKILHKRSAVEFKSATGAQLEIGELGLNYHESGPYLQCKDAAGEVVQLGGVYVGASAPGNELKGAWWLRDSDNTLFLYDGTSWVSIAGGTGGGGGGTITVIGGDGIEATTVGDVVTVSVDLASNSHGLSIVGGKLQADIATETTLGTVKIGEGLDIAADGTLTVDGGETVQYGRALTLDGGTSPSTLNADIATAAALGVVKVGDGIDVDAAGEISVSFPPSETYIGETPPADPVEGDLWWNSSDDSGRLYVYYEDANSSQWVEASPQGDTLTEGDADVLYLSKVSNDTAAGAITFEKLTTHESGVSVTGGNVTINPGQLKQGTTTSAAAAGTGVQLNGFVRAYGNETDFPETERSTPQPFQIISAPTASSTKAVKLSLNASGSAYFAGITEHEGGVSVTGVSGNTNKGIVIQGANTVSSSAADYGVFVNPTPPAAHTGEYIGYHYRGSQIQSTQPLSVGFEAATNAADKASLNIGFRGMLDSGVGNNFNFYAQGDAPNYFRGGLTVGVSATNNPGVGTNTGTQILASGLTIYGRSSATASDANLILNRSSNNNGRIIEFKENGTFADAIILDGSGGVTFGTSDYRLKENIVDLPSATDAIKSLRPVNYNFKSHPGKTRPGFVAHELQETLPVAVVGTKDATEAIGTLADYDGTVLETAVTEPSAEELTYTEEVETDGVTTATVRTRTWTPTGTRPVYQGVDQTKLIPLLTKALQEVMSKNEELETRLAALEGA